MLSDQPSRRIIAQPLTVAAAPVKALAEDPRQPTPPAMPTPPAPQLTAG